MSHYTQLSLFSLIPILLNQTWGLTILFLVIELANDSKGNPCEVIPNQSFYKPLYCNANPAQCNMSSTPYKYWFRLNITIKFRLSQYARGGCFVENVLFVLPHPSLFGGRLSLCSPGWSVSSPTSAFQELWVQVSHLPLSRVFQTLSPRLKPSWTEFGLEKFC